MKIICLKDKENTVFNPRLMRELNRTTFETYADFIAALSYATLKEKGAPPVAECVEWWGDLGEFLDWLNGSDADEIAELADCELFECDWIKG